MAPLHPVPADHARGALGIGPGRGDGRTQSHHRQDAPAVGAVLAVWASGRAGMEDRGAGRRGLLQPRDRVAASWRIRVVGRGEHDRHGRVPGRREHPALQPQRCSGAREVALCGAHEQRAERHCQARQQSLNLGIAKPRVALDQDGPLRREHEAGVERATKRCPATGELGDDREVDDVDERRAQPVGQIGHGAIRAHAAGVRPRVLVEQTLVVASRRERQRTMVVAQRDQARFGADESFLNDHDRRLCLRYARSRPCGLLVGALVPRQIGEQRPKRGLGLGRVVANGDALARHQTVGLDDHPA